jgi:hypothetical protein
MEFLPGLCRQIDGPTNAAGLRGISRGSDCLREVFQAQGAVRIRHAKRYHPVRVEGSTDFFFG